LLLCGGWQDRANRLKPLRAMTDVTT